MKSLDTDADPRVVGPFELLARLGEGGMGVAYLARRRPLDGPSEELATAYRFFEPNGGDGDADPSRFVVVKMIQPGLLDSQAARERFDREVDSVRAVVSSRVPALVAAEPEAAKPWFAMDYIAGPDLDALVRKCGTLPVGACAALGLDLVEALRDIHRTGLLHRDLKPKNVVLGPDGPVVLDFGLAVLSERRTSQAITRPGEAWGSWPYASYEQLREFQSVKEPTDVYALGATLYFALKGAAPYRDGPLLTPPSWNGIDSTFRPLLGQIIVPTPGQRPDLDGVETGLRAALAEANLSPELAAEQLRNLLADAALTPKLPPEALSDRVDPAVAEPARKEAEAELPDDTPGFYGLVDTDEIERAQEETEPADAEAPGGGHPPTVPDAEPTAVDEQPADAPAPPPTEPIGRAATPQPAEPSSPAAAKVPRPAQKVAARLRRQYARQGTL